jgi:aldehyde:ferredoxin oxidoreductase
MGADHTAGPAVANRKAYLNKEYGQLDDPKTKIDLSKELQIFLMLLDSAGICYFVGPSNESVGIIVKLIAARYGWTKSWEEWIQWARKCLSTEHKFNIQAGLSPDQQQLPDFMQKEPLLDYNRRWDIDPNTLKRFWDNF